MAHPRLNERVDLAHAPLDVALPVARCFCRTIGSAMITTLKRAPGNRSTDMGCIAAPNRRAMRVDGPRRMHGAAERRARRTPWLNF